MATCGGRRFAREEEKESSVDSICGGRRFACARARAREEKNEVSIRCEGLIFLEGFGVDLDW